MGFYCATGSLNVFGGTNITGADYIVVSQISLLFPISAVCLFISSLFALEFSPTSHFAVWCVSILLIFRASIFHHAGADRLRVSTAAGSGLSTPLAANGIGAAATFNSPYGIVVDTGGIAYIGDYGNNRVRQLVLSTGAVTTLAGSATAGFAVGTGTTATFSGPMYAALDGLGNLYVTDFAGIRVRKVVLATQAVSTVAGTGAAGSVDAVGAAASFNKPRGIAIDASGNAYVADFTNNRIRKIVLSSAIVTTFAGSPTSVASASNGVGTNAGFSSPNNVVVDSSGELLFVADGTNRLIRQIVIATQTVTTLAGSVASGSANGVGIAAQFNSPWGLAVDSSGNLFVSDTGSNLIRQIVIATQTVTTLAGSGAASWADGFGTNAAFNQPTGLAVDARGNMLVAECVNHRVRVLQPTVLCPVGVYCAPGTDAAICTVGYYCALGADRMPCAAGGYCPSGSGSAAGAGACPAGYYCPAGSDRVACASCAAGSTAPPPATVTRTTAVWTVGENGAGIVNYKCVTNALGVSASLAFSAISVRVARGVFAAVAYASAESLSGSQQGTWLYQGCFTDSAARLLPVQLATSLGPTDAALSCMALARAAGFSVVGMEMWNPPTGECWGLPPNAISNWRTTGVNEGNCGDGDIRLPVGLRWGLTNWGMAIYQFNLPVPPVSSQKYGIMSPGYQTAFPSDHFMWDIVFPTPTTVSVCATSHNRINGWGDATLKGSFSGSLCVYLSLVHADLRALS